MFRRMGMSACRSPNVIILVMLFSSEVSIPLMPIDDVNPIP